LAGIEEIIVNDHYLVVVGISLFFTVFALARRTAILDVIATICWWISGGVHLVSSPSTSPLFSLSYLWFALGIVFFVLLWVDIFKLWNFRKQNDPWMDAEGW
jgi:type VI protein secretion system component VasK